LIAYIEKIADKNVSNKIKSNKEKVIE